MKLFEEQWIRGAKPTTKPRDGESGGGKLTKQIGKRSRTETAGGKCKIKKTDEHGKMLGTMERSSYEIRRAIREGSLKGGKKGEGLRGGPR